MYFSLISVLLILVHKLNGDKWNYKCITCTKQSLTCLGLEQRVGVRRVTRQVCFEGESA